MVLLSNECTLKNQCYQSFVVKSVVKSMDLLLFYGLSAVVVTSSLVAAIRSTPQPPYRHPSFARQIFYGGFAGYLLLSAIPSAANLYSAFIHTITLAQSAFYFNSPTPLPKVGNPVRATPC